MFVFFKIIIVLYDVFIIKCNDRLLSVLKISKLSNKNNFNYKINLVYDLGVDVKDVKICLVVYGGILVFSNFLFYWR